MNLATAKGLGYGAWLHHVSQSQGNGTECLRIRVNGAPKTWKTRPTEIRLPVRWGMRARDQFSLTEHDLADWEREADCKNPLHPETI